MKEPPGLIHLLSKSRLEIVFKFCADKAEKRES